VEDRAQNNNNTNFRGLWRSDLQADTVADMPKRTQLEPKMMSDSPDRKLMGRMSGTAMAFCAIPTVE